jgi:GDPmannose 4,6-dehydratase
LRIAPGSALSGVRMKRALICGISGQDGSLLAKLLIEKGYKVVGTSRDADLSRFENLSRLGIRDRISVGSMTLDDIRSVIQVLKEVKADEIYNLAGPSSVGLSFQQPVETLDSMANGTLNLLEAMRFEARRVHLYNSASGDCFGQTEPGQPATETSPLRPRSPYAVAKAAAFRAVASYREAYGLFACSGIMFNHESSLRPCHFVTRKVVQAACRIAAGSAEQLSVGSTSVMRDWGYAPEYVEAMWIMLHQPAPRDYVIATGESHALEEFIAAAFAEVGLDWRDHTRTDPALIRAADITSSYAAPSLARTELGWQARTRMHDLVRVLVAEERERQAEPVRGISAVFMDGTPTSQARLRGYEVSCGAHAKA